jgi:hypothetical protein
MGFESRRRPGQRTALIGFLLAVPKRTDIRSIAVLGSGPIVIGQACEFDYSGTQACRVLRGEGYRVVLVNSNPATIMTDPEFADATYVEPLDVPSLTRIIERERPDALLPTLGGQTALNLAIELEEHGVATLRALAELPLPLPFKPKRSAPESYQHVHTQARLQLASRGQPIAFELLEIVPERGLCRLPEPTPADVFLDLEGAPFAGEIGSGGREYLFGIVTIGAAGEPVYRALWADSLAAEKAAFEELVDLIQRQREATPGMHVFHYAPYEPSALKRLMCRHATRENEIDALLRSGAFVDLYAIVRQSLRAGVERYSIKNLEPLFAYTRDVELSDARRQLQALELATAKKSETTRPSFPRSTRASSTLAPTRVAACRTAQSRWPTPSGRSSSSTASQSRSPRTSSLRTSCSTSRRRALQAPAASIGSRATSH